MVSDPRCPACDGHVGATATHCMHCGATFAGPTEGRQGDDGDDTARSTESTHEPTVPTGDSNGGDAAEAGHDGRRSRLARWMAPDGWLDDTLTVVVGAGIGIVVGFLFFILCLQVLPSDGAVAVVALTGWLGAMGYLIRRRTVYGAVQDGLYASAGLYLLLGLYYVVTESTDGVVGTLVGTALVFGLPALVVYKVGEVAGRRRPDGECPWPDWTDSLG